MKEILRYVVEEIGKIHPSCTHGSDQLALTKAYTHKAVC